MRAIVLLVLLTVQAPPGAPAGAYRTPLIEVRGERLTVDEVIARAARIEEEALRSDLPRRFTSHVRFVAIYGETADPRCKREVIDEVSRVEEGRGPVAGRSILLWGRSETWRGDSLVESKSGDIARKRFAPQIEQILRIPLALRRGLFRYRIVERRRLSDGSLIHVLYRPRQGFAPLPEGDAWLETRDYVVSRQTGSLTRNAPLPFLIRSIDGFSIHRSKYGPIWIEDEMWLRLSLRRSFGGPDRFELAIRLTDVAIGEAVAAREPTRESASTHAIIDSLEIADLGRVDRFLRKPRPIEAIRAVTRGDSLLGAMGGSPVIRPHAWRPVLRYGHAERLFTGVRLAFGSGGPASLDLEGGYASALERMTGNARLAIGFGAGGRRRIGGWVGGGSEIHRFAPIFPVVDFVQAVAFGVDSQDALFRRQGSVGVRAGAGKVGEISLSARIVRDRAIPSRTLWSLFGGRSRGDPFRPIDPGETRMVALDVALRGIASWLTLRVSGETGRTATPGASFVGTRDLRCGFTARPILPGGRRLSLRGGALVGDIDLPLQDRLYMGGGFTLRGYDRGALTGCNGYHVGGELFLNRDIVGWLPWIPDRGLGLEAFLAGDYGRILSDRHARPGEISGALASAGAGFAWTVGLPGLPRVLVGLHRGLGGGDREWRLRVEAEPERFTETGEVR